MNDKNFIINYLDKRYERLPYARGSVGYISNKYPNNTLLITMQGHITCSKNGVIYDSFDCTDRKVEYVWIVD